MNPSSEVSEQLITAVCPSGTIYTSFWPDICAGLHMGGSRPLAYDTNKTRRAEAPFGPAGDDNGRRYEPPPQDRIGLVTAFMPSRRRLPAAPGKPSFPYFKVYYLPRRCVLAEPSQRTCDVESPRLDGARKIRRPGPQPPESEDWGRPPRVGEDGILPYRLALATILAVKWTGH
ncbi:hypothetical protein THAOC_35461, partial [Thalassiosira oceanica]